MAGGGTSLPNICSRSVAADSILSFILTLDRVSMHASPACVKLSRVRVSNRTQTGFTSVRWITNPFSSHRAGHFLVCSHALQFTLVRCGTNVPRGPSGTPQES
jgi:hypothetical protein